MGFVAKQNSDFWVFWDTLGDNNNHENYIQNNENELIDGISVKTLAQPQEEAHRGRQSGRNETSLM